MSSLGNFLFIILVIWVFLRTLSYGKWEWKKKNKLGGTMVMLLGVSVILLTFYELFK